MPSTLSTAITTKVKPTDRRITRRYRIQQVLRLAPVHCAVLSPVPSRRYRLTVRIAAQALHTRVRSLNEHEYDVYYSPTPELAIARLVLTYARNVLSLAKWSLATLPEFCSTKVGFNRLMNPSPLGTTILAVLDARRRRSSGRSEPVILGLCDM